MRLLQPPKISTCSELLGCSGSMKTIALLFFCLFVCLFFVFFFCFFVSRVDLLPYDLITQLFRILSVAYDSRGKENFTVIIADHYAIKRCPRTRLDRFLVSIHRLTPNNSCLLN